MKNICVYCGSKPGRRAEFSTAAENLGRLLARQQRTLVFGGGSVGLMGVVADAVLQSRGHVIGVIPHALSGAELLHADVDEMHVVPDMHARKMKMAECSDAFVAMPGGFGTFDELFEIITWAQLGFHRKPIGLLNVDGFFDPLITFLDSVIAEEFIKSNHRELIIVDRSPEALLERMESHTLPEVRVWNGPDNRT